MRFMANTRAPQDGEGGPGWRQKKRCPKAGNAPRGRSNQKTNAPAWRPEEKMSRDVTKGAPGFRQLERGVVCQLFCLYVVSVFRRAAWRVLVPPPVTFLRAQVSMGATRRTPASQAARHSHYTADRSVVLTQGWPRGVLRSFALAVVLALSPPYVYFSLSHSKVLLGLDFAFAPFVLGGHKGVLGCRPWRKSASL